MFNAFSNLEPVQSSTQNPPVCSYSVVVVHIFMFWLFTIIKWLPRFHLWHAIDWLFTLQYQYITVRSQAWVEVSTAVLHLKCCSWSVLICPYPVYCIIVMQKDAHSSMNNNYELNFGAETARCR